MREADALNHLGEFYYSLGRLKEARIEKEKALEIYRRLQDHSGQARALFDLGYLDSDGGSMEEARGNFQRASRLWRQLGDSRGQAQCLRALAQLHDRRGEWQEALDLYSRAVPLVRTSGDKVWLASVLNGVATVHFKLGDVERARRGLSEARDIFKAVGLLTGEASNLMQLGVAHFALGETEASLKALHEALALFRKIGDQRMQSNTLRNIGSVLAAQGRLEESEGYLRKALALKRPEEDRRWAAYTLIDLGGLQLERSRYQQALDRFQEALRLSRRAQDKTGEALARYNLSEAYRGLGRLDEAIEEMQKAVELAERLRGKVASLELRTIYGTRLHQFHEGQVRLLMEAERSRPGQGYAALAFQASERRRARTLIDALKGGRNYPPGSLPHGVSQDLGRILGEMEQMNRRLSHLLTRPGEPARQEAAAIARKLADLSIRADKLLSRQGGPRQGSTRIPTLAQIQQHLDEETALVEFALTEPTSYLWVVSRSAFNAYPLPARSSIEKEARSLYARLSQDSRIGRNAWKSAAKRLSKLLFTGLRRQLPPRILVVSDGALRVIPLGVLPSPQAVESGRLLIDRHEIIRLPSASFLTTLRDKKRRRAERGLAVFADPVFSPRDPRLGKAVAAQVQARPAVRGPRSFAGEAIPRLLFTRREARTIQRLSGPSTLLAMGLQASREQALNHELGRFDILHFATHGLANDEYTHLSGLIFSLFTNGGARANGFVRQDEIAQMRLHARLVVLSACGTALGKTVEGEGLMNMVRSFFQAGAGSVAATLWPVDDRATSDLMIRFYRSLLKEGKSAPTALREAQTGIRALKAWRHPYYWAAFTLHGEWDWVANPTEQR